MREQRSAHSRSRPVTKPGRLGPRGDPRPGSSTVCNYALRLGAGAERVWFTRADDARKIRADACAAALLRTPIALHAAHGAPAGECLPDDPGHEDTPLPERSGDPTAADHGTPYLTSRFVRELHSIEANRDFTWAGYVIKDLLPRLGVGEREAQRLFDLWVHEGLLLLEKLPNPKNPDRPSTNVRLNRDRPTVKAALPNGRPKERFAPLGHIPGEPLSVTILRERR
jgi:hypothetical protein